MPNTGPVVELGQGCVIDVGVALGYPASRGENTDKVSIGDNARIRSGSVIYGGAAIGRNLQTGHNVVIREENRIGDGVSIWNNTVIDYGCTIGDGVKIPCPGCNHRERHTPRVRPVVEMHARTSHRKRRSDRSQRHYTALPQNRTRKSDRRRKRGYQGHTTAFSGIRQPRPRGRRRRGSHLHLRTYR
jgi:NDP-sugar pyrophosphorylase family protein